MHPSKEYFKLSLTEILARRTLISNTAKKRATMDNVSKLITPEPRC